MSLKYQVKKFWLFASYFLRPTYLAKKCGHTTKRSGMMDVFGHTIIMTMPKNKDFSVDYCISCVSKMSIRCAWCGKPIVIGDPVTLYSPAKADYKVPEYAVWHDKKEKQLVGCLRWECADTGMDRAGFWLPPGKVERVPTAVEMIFAAGGKKGLIINDLHNPGDLGTFFETGE
jgi:hypothetical protein